MNGMPADKISLENAKKDKLFYVVFNVVVFRDSDKKCLILKRSEEEKAHPGKYGVIGGKMEWGDFDLKKPSRINGDVLDYENVVKDVLKREAIEEAGIEIQDNLKYINSIGFIRPDGIPCFLLKFAGKYKSGEVKLEESFSDFKWINASEIEKFDCIDGIKEEIRETIYLFS